MEQRLLYLNSWCFRKKCRTVSQRNSVVRWAVEIQWLKIEIGKCSIIIQWPYIFCETKSYLYWCFSLSDASRENQEQERKAIRAETPNIKSISGCKNPFCFYQFKHIKIMVSYWTKKNKIKWQEQHETHPIGNQQWLTLLRIFYYTYTQTRMVAFWGSPPKGWIK